MPTPLRRGLRRAHTGLWYATAATLVLLAVLVGVTSQLLPMAERHPERVEAWLSERAGRPVAFDSLQTRWTRRGPLLSLGGLRLGSGADAISVGEAEMLVSMYAGVLPGSSFTELRLRNLDLVLERAEDATWSVRGLPGQARRGDPLANLEGLGEVQVIDATLEVLAPSLGWHVRVPEIDLRLRVDGSRVRAGAHAWPRTDAPPLRLALELDRESGDGRAHARATQLQLADWSALLRVAGVGVASGRGDVEAWLDLGANRVEGVTANLDLGGVVLRGAGADADTAVDVASRALDQVRGRLHWQGLADGWRLDAQGLELGPAGAAQALNGTALADGERWQVVADGLQVGPLLGVLALSDRLEPGVRSWLLQSGPDALLSQLELAGDREGLSRGSGRITQGSFAALDDRPGLSGLSGNFLGDAHGLALQLDPEMALRVDWPAGFGRAHDFQVDGQLVGWREGEGWRVQAPDLRVRGDQVGLHLRGGLGFQGDGTRPWLDLAADVDRAPIVAAKGFWVRHRMSPAAVAWLDRALLDGQLLEGRALVSGDLDDWPFTANQGRFDAGGRIAGGRIAFNPEWPSMEQVEAELRFIGNGFTVAGSGELAGVPVARFDAGIEDFAEGDLVVNAGSATDATRLLSLVRQSPLARGQEETLASLAASGPATVDFALLQPMRARNAARRSLGGTVVLDGARLSDQRSGVELEDVDGKATYDARGFAADDLQVRSAGQPGVLSLRSGAHARDPANAFEARLSAIFGVEALLARAPALDWLAPHVRGQSRWRIELAVARDAGPRRSRLALRSDLVGTTLELPAPLDKPAARPLATSIVIGLPQTQGGAIEVALGRLLALRSQGSGAQAGVRVALGTDRVPEGMPLPGLSVGGRTDTLEALEWVGIVAGGRPAAQAGPQSGATPPAAAGVVRRPALALRGIDVGTAQLRMLGAGFPDARVRVRPDGDGYAVALTGPALQGDLQVPGQGDAPISGRFERVHWRSLPSAPATVAAGSRAQAPAARAELDPADVPPLSLDIEDLRFGDADLGAARLRTAPMPGGLDVQQLALRSPGQQIEIKGGWTGTAATARTRLSAAMESENLGNLLRDLGFDGRIEGGSGSVLMESTWNGGPAAFGLAAMQGNLRIDVRDGQLLEVDPGAGRVLGLLSLAQLPRRMSLDFRDFFDQGFAFDRLQGNIGFGDGRASSEDLRLEGPAAEIQIRGSTDLRAQVYDQTILVQPRSGTLLTVVGAVAGGPLGAAVGAAANAVLARPLGELGARTYRVTGPWKDPEVEVLSREQSGAQAGGTVPGTGGR